MKEKFEARHEKNFSSLVKAILSRGKGKIFAAVNKKNYRRQR